MQKQQLEMAVSAGLAHFNDGSVLVRAQLTEGISTLKAMLRAIGEGRLAVSIVPLDGQTPAVDIPKDTKAPAANRKQKKKPAAKAS